ncbi:hypothetical protein HDU84_007217 [Entophlyctis sp. JEL0112]|nr:hypothetical protein HDU84_007217 [Entophlyctis sp. JEL0112]
MFVPVAAPASALKRKLTDAAECWDAWDSAVTSELDADGSLLDPVDHDGDYTDDNHGSNQHGSTNDIVIDYNRADPFQLRERDGAAFAKYYRFSGDGDDASSQPIQDPAASAPAPSNKIMVKCIISPACAGLPPFATRAEYRDHCRAAHFNVCSTCRRILPTIYLLDLHISELHDPFFVSFAEKENSYKCFVEGCNRKCSGPFKRKLHLMAKHSLPPTFNFHIVLGKGRGKDGLGTQQSKKPFSRSPKFPSAPVSEAAKRNIPTAQITDVDEMEVIASVKGADNNKPTDTEKKKSRRNHRKKKQSESRSASGDCNCTPLAVDASSELKSPPIEQDSFGTLVETLKSLSLVPRSVQSAKSTKASTYTTQTVTNKFGVHTQRPFPPNPLENQAVSELKTKENMPIQLESTHLTAEKAESMGISGRNRQGDKNHIWTREKALATYLQRVPERAREAELLWKEQRAQRVAQKMEADGVQVTTVEVDGNYIEIEEDEDDENGMR